mgnify:CR=1 FL=1
MFDWITDIWGTGTGMMEASGKIKDFLELIFGLAGGDLTELSSANPIGSITEGVSVPGSVSGSVSGSN